jgi:hypothetical protein
VIFQQQHPALTAPFIFSLKTGEECSLSVQETLCLGGKQGWETSGLDHFFKNHIFLPPILSSWAVDEQV